MLSPIKRFVSQHFHWSGHRCYSTVQPYVAAESPPKNLPTFLSTDTLRDPKQRALDLYMPHRHISYEEELKLKQRQLESRFQTVAKTLFYDRGLHPSIRALIRTNNANLCPIRDIQQTSATSEYLTSCIADLGKSRSGDLALGLPNRSFSNDPSATDDDRQSMFVLPIDDIEIYKKRDRLIVQHYYEFLQQEIKNVSNLDRVLHHWRPIRIFTNKKDKKLVTIGYFDRKTARQTESNAAKERLERYFHSGPGKECQIDYLYFERRQQRWPIIVNDTSYEQIIGNEKTQFSYDLFGMKFEANLQSYGINNIAAYESVLSEVLKVCPFDGNSSVFLQYFSDLGVLPLVAVQHVDQSYGLDPSRYAIETSRKTQEKYVHTRDVQLRTCSNRDDFQAVLKEIESRKKKNASLTCVFGPPRFELERNELRQNKLLASALRECEFIDRLIVVNRGMHSAVLHLLYCLSGGESSAQKISGDPFKPVLIIPFDGNPRSSLSCDFLIIYERHS